MGAVRSALVAALSSAEEATREIKEALRAYDNGARVLYYDAAPVWKLGDAQRALARASMAQEEEDAAQEEPMGD